MKSPLCDIVVITWNRSDLLKPCLESIDKHTALPVRVIVIDNGSDAETLEYAEKRKMEQAGSFIYVRNRTNEGFVRAVNQGFDLSIAPYICICNNDIIVTEGWLEEMITIALKDRDIGVINPQSSTFGQHPAPDESIDAFADRKIFPDRGRFAETGQCIGFCMLIKKPVVDKVGGFETSLDTAFFEDTDFCKKAVRAGFKCVIALGSYVFHHEHASVRTHEESERLFAENRRRLERKWGVPQRILMTSSADYRMSERLVHDKTKNAIAVSREDNYVYLYQKGIYSSDMTRYYDRLGLVRYLNVQIFFAAPGLYAARVIWRIVTRKRKKKFNLALVDSRRLARMINAIYPLHGTRAYFHENNEDNQRLWMKKYRFPLSS